MLTITVAFSPHHFTDQHNHHILHLHLLLLLFLMVPASALGGLGLSGLLVLGHLKLLVRIAPCAEGVPSLGHVHHLEAFLR